MDFYWYPRKNRIVAIELLCIPSLASVKSSTDGTLGCLFFGNFFTSLLKFLIYCWSLITSFCPAWSLIKNHCLIIFLRASSILSLLIRTFIFYLLTMRIDTATGWLEVAALQNGDGSAIKAQRIFDPTYGFLCILDQRTLNSKLSSFIYLQTRESKQNPGTNLHFNSIL